VIFRIVLPIHMPQKRQLLFASAVKVFFIVWLCIACTSCDENTRPKNRTTTYWSSNNGGEIAFARWAVTQWNAEHPENPVSFQPVPEGQSSEEILLAAVVAGTTPDLYSNIWQGLVDFYSQSGALVALDTLDGFSEYIHERCDSATIAEITAPDGHIYQIPWKINPIMTIYNRRLIRDLGLDSFPATYSSFLAAAAKFSQDTDGNGYVDQWFGNTSVKLAWYQRLFNFYTLYLAASGGKPLIEKGKAAFNNKEAVGVFRFLQELYRKNYFSRQSESAGQDLFISEKYASKWTGPWEIEYLDKFKRDNFTYDFAPIVVPDGHSGPRYTYCDPKNIVIFKTCPYPQQAFEFIKFMTNKEGDLAFLRETSQLPRRKNLLQDTFFAAYFQSHPFMQKMASQAKYIRGADHSESLIEVFDILSQEYEACVLYQRKSPEQAIADAERAVNVLLRVKK
jgi:multiple sugar transport system substrate-binding protein